MVKISLKNLIPKNLIPLAIVIASILVAGAIIYVNQSKISQGRGENIIEEGIFSSAQIGDKVIKYLNENVLGDNNKAFLVDISEENGLYKLTINVGGQEFLSYASPDGKFLFTQFINLEQKAEKQSPTEMPKTEKPEVNLFVMSFCPYGNQAEDIMKPVIELLGDKINFNIHYIFSKDSKGGYISLHGEQELNQGVREICVFKYQKEKFWGFIDKINKSCTSSNADSCWEGVAQSLGIDVQKIKNCQTSEYNSILEAELKINQEFEVSGSPQLFVNGVEYQGARTSEAYKTAICSGFENPPSECQQTLSSESGGATGGCQ